MAFKPMQEHLSPYYSGGPTYYLMYITVVVIIKFLFFFLGGGLYFSIYLCIPSSLSTVILAYIFSKFITLRRFVRTTAILL